MNNRFKNFIPKAIYWLMYLLLGRVIVFYINQNDKFAIKCYFNFSDKYFLLEFIAAIFSAFKKELNAVVENIQKL